VAIKPGLLKRNVANMKLKICNETLQKEPEDEICIGESLRRMKTWTPHAGRCGFMVS
jgi:hypothetical protein